jgi:hypothetical protein
LVVLDFQDLYLDVVAVEGEGVGSPCPCLLTFMVTFVARRGGGLNGVELDMKVDIALVVGVKVTEDGGK